MEIGELRAFAREPVDVWRSVPLRAEDAEVAVTLIVRENDDDVREPVGSGSGGRERAQREEEGEYAIHHESSTKVFSLLRQTLNRRPKGTKAGQVCGASF